MSRTIRTRQNTNGDPIPGYRRLELVHDVTILEIDEPGALGQTRMRVTEVHRATDHRRGTMVGWVEITEEWEVEP